MTISTTSDRTTQQGNGATTQWPFGFAVQNTGQIVVTYTDAAGNDSVLNPSVYSVALTTLGGTVTYPLSGSPLATGTKITLQRIVSLVQLTNLRNQGSYSPAVVEAALDYLTMIGQQINDTVGRGLVFPVSDINPATILPSAVQRAGLTLGFDVNGDPALVTSPGSLTVSGYITALLQKTTAALARGYLGSSTVGDQLFVIASASAALTLLGGAGLALSNTFAGDNILSGNNYFSGANKYFPEEVFPGQPAAPTLGASGSGNTLPTATYYVKVSYTITGAGGSTYETIPSAETSQAITLGQLLTVTAPSAPTSNLTISGYNVYIASSSGNETKQNSVPVAIGVNYTQGAPLAAGAAVSAGLLLTANDFGKLIRVHGTGTVILPDGPFTGVASCWITPRRTTDVITVARQTSATLYLDAANQGVTSYVMNSPSRGFFFLGSAGDWIGATNQPRTYGNAGAVDYGVNGLAVGKLSYKSLVATPNFGDGSDGAATLTTGNLAAGVYNYTDLTINGGNTITVTGSGPLIIRVSGTLTLAGTVVHQNGQTGVAAASPTADNWTRLGGNGGRGGNNGSNPINEGGATLNSATSGTAASAALLSTAIKSGCWFINGGSAGAGEAGASQNTTGGNGGGAVIIIAQHINFTGTVNCAGVNGTSGSTGSPQPAGAGGGGGGVIAMISPHWIADSGTRNVAAGTAGTNGGGNAGQAGGAGTTLTLTTV